MPRKLTQEEFIEKAKEIHGDRYRYDFVKYQNHQIKVDIFCEKHGIFEQTPNSHLQNKNCYKCGRESTGLATAYTTAEFIELASKVHNNKYEYPDKYKNNCTKINIICPEHGNFKQTPSTHLRAKQGCPKCATDSVRITTLEFINRGNIVHNYKYDYSLVECGLESDKVKIICPEHGLFEQNKTRHLCLKSGCPKCSGWYKTTKEFIDEANKIHNNKYNYSKTDYKSTYEKIIVICCKHGEFEQKPSNHLSGRGCSKCRKSVGEEKIANFLITNNIEFKDQHKFNDCKDKGLLKFDFYLNKLNICIEFDGEQHFTTIKNWGGIGGLLNIQKKDRIKTDYCKKNNIELLRIRFDENVVDKLDEFFKSQVFINKDK